ncbi:MAG: (2Fe-2S)-binding protein [Actinomycetota bacterium]|jgi:bacterioferritin-associated ferredoxin
MWVCHCKGVTDGQIRSAISAGARTVVEIGAHCRAGTGCGGCLPEVCRLLDDHLTSLAYYAAHGGSRRLDRGDTPRPPGCGDCPLGADDTDSELLSA